jgi:hypothetical protein
MGEVDGDGEAASLARARLAPLIQREAPSSPTHPQVDTNMMVLVVGRGGEVAFLSDQSLYLKGPRGKKGALFPPLGPRLLTD